MFRKWNCFHHNVVTGESWIKSRLIDLGRNKMWVCTHCWKRWFLY